MSIVFDARKHAEQSKRAREAIAETFQSPDSGPASTDPQETTASNEIPNHAPERPDFRPGGDGLSASSEKPSGTLLGLRVERRSTDLRLRWNRDAAANATRGRVTIADGLLHKQLDLDTNELRNGSIFYTPKTDDVFLGLEIETAGSNTPASESLRVVGSAASPHQPQKETRPAARAGPSRIARSDAAWAGRTAMSGTTAGKQAPLVRSLLRAPRSESQSVESQTPDTVEPGGQIEPATLVLRVDPAYPASAKQSQISGSVELRFRISPEGKVYDVRPVRGVPVLARAAIQAVEGWCYEPARLNGAPIDSQASTNFDFELN